MKFNTPTNSVLYSIEKAIKAYRKLSLQNISNVVPEITVDQALILVILEENNKSQSEVADLVFKDYASMTRIVKLMIDKDYLTKSTDKNDRRKAKLGITPRGKKVIEKLNPVIEKNRQTALASLTNKELEQLYTTLDKITNNCLIPKK